MRLNECWMLMALIFSLMAEPVWATGLGGIGPGNIARNPMEAYCLNHGGTPSGGYCYFPDGYCDLQSFYNGTCPGKGYYEDALWMSEAYRFLYGDERYYMPSTPFVAANTALSYPNYYNYYYWPTYLPGYSPNWL